MPKKDFTTKTFIWQCVAGLKKVMTRDGANNTLKYHEHNPGFTIKENTIKYWCEHEAEF